MRHPAALPALALLAGTTAGMGVALPSGMCATGMVAAWMLTGVALARARPGVVAACAAVGFACGGAALGGQADWDAAHSTLRAALAAARGGGDLSSDPIGTVDLSGVLGEDAAPAEAGGARLSIEVSAMEVDGHRQVVSGGVSLTVVSGVGATDRLQWRRGRHVTVTAQLRRPARYLNPGVPDFERAAARRGTTLVGSIKSRFLVQVDADGSALEEIVATLRGAARRVLDAAVGRWSARSAAVAKAVILGDRTGLDEETEDRLQRAGTYHVIAISGGNIAILAGLLFFLMRGLVTRSGASEILISLVLVAYAVLVGGGASVNRATLMAVMLLLAHAADTRGSALNALAAAAALSLAAEPLLVWDVGAWLTYGATLAIILGGPLAARIARPLPALLRGAVALFSASLCAELALFPIAALVFARVTAAGLLLNFAAIPLMAVVQIGGMAAIGLSWALPALDPWLGWVTHQAAWGLVESARLVNVMPWVTTRLPPPAAPPVVAYYVAWIVWFAWRRARPVAIIGAGMAAVWIIVAASASAASRNALSVTWCDVGQGDATVIQFPGGETWIVDAGGTASTRFDIARRVVEPAAWARGVRRLDRFLFTHGDNDHVGGAPSLIRDLSPKDVWEGIAVPADENVSAMHRAAAEAGATWRHVGRGATHQVGAVTVVVWHPDAPDYERRKVRNDDSVVLALKWGDVLIVLPGDIEAAAESMLAPVAVRGPITIVQAPHHGSKSSSSEPWVRALEPAVVVMSVGRGNRFGHPARDVIARYRDWGASVFRTDQDGAVTVTTDGRTADVRTVTGRRMILTPAGKTALPPS